MKAHGSFNNLFKVAKSSIAPLSNHKPCTKVCSGQQANITRHASSAHDVVQYQTVAWHVLLLQSSPRHLVALLGVALQPATHLDLVKAVDFEGQNIRVRDSSGWLEGDGHVFGLPGPQESWSAHSLQEV